ncbi:MAG: EutN/CcmL family microcompartment protein [Elusimicrobia bacterium]|nr:EutN/CcmL family microcompartment protein [Elusimicrobiota bacterium]
MVFARVVGTVVSTNKEPKLVGKKLLLVQPVEAGGAPKGGPLVAVDAVGSGEGEFVLLVQGSSARQTAATEGNPVDCAIVAIVDTVEQGGKAVFEKGKDPARR